MTAPRRDASAPALTARPADEYPASAGYPAEGPASDAAGLAADAAMGAQADPSAGPGSRYDVRTQALIERVRASELAARRRPGGKKGQPGWTGPTMVRRYWPTEAGLAAARPWLPQPAEVTS